MKPDYLRSKISNYKPNAQENSLLNSKLAAVFVLLYKYNNELSLLLQIRSENLQHHPGEIGFPGGSKENIDASLFQTACREVDEEIGVSKSNIEFIGELDAVLTSTKFLIYPFVGLIKTKSKFVLSSEVKKMLFVPINELNNQINWRYDYIFNENSLKNYKSFYYDGNIIFGATAKIINNLLNILNKQS